MHNPANPANPAKHGEKLSPCFLRADIGRETRYPAGFPLSIEPPGFFAGLLAGFIL